MSLKQAVSATAVAVLMPLVQLAAQSGQTTSTVNVGSVAGRVVVEQASQMLPLRRATVTLRRSAQSQFLTATDLDGRYRFDTVAVRLEERLPATVSWLKRAGAVAAGLGVLGATTRIVLRSRRRRRGDRRLNDLEKRLDRLERRFED